MRKDERHAKAIPSQHRRSGKHVCASGAGTTLRGAHGHLQGWRCPRADVEDAYMGAAAQRAHRHQLR
eukprot:1440163-Alexandrium_andersonii.AAC.1